MEIEKIEGEQQPVQVASELNDRLGGPMTDFDYVMEGLGELARLTGPNDAAQYALAALDMKKRMDLYRSALLGIITFYPAEEKAGFLARKAFLDDVQDA